MTTVCPPHFNVVATLICEDMPMFRGVILKN